MWGAELQCTAMRGNKDVTDKYRYLQSNKQTQEIKIEDLPISGREQS